MGCGNSTQAHGFDVWTHADAEKVDGGLKRIAFVVNPYSGGKQGAVVSTEARKAVLERLPGSAVEMFPTSYAGHAAEIMETTDWTGFDAVVSVGGDGTFHECVNGMMKRIVASSGEWVPPPICMIPCGSGNTIAYDLGIVTAADAVNNIVAQTIRRMDVLELTDPDDTTEYTYAAPDAVDGEDGDTESKDAAAAGDEGAAAEAAAGGTGDASADTAARDTSTSEVQLESSKEDDATHAASGKPELEGGFDFPHPIYSVNIVGFGLPSAVLATANRLRCCGSAQYNLAAYCEVCSNPTYPTTIEFPNGPAEAATAWAAAGTEFAMIQAQATVHMGEKMPFCPRSKLDDGLMDLVGIKHAGRGTLVGVMEDAKKGTHVNSNAVVYVQTSEFVMRPQAPDQSGTETVNVDGELTGFSPVRVRCVPRVLRVLAGSA